MMKRKEKYMNNKKLIITKKILNLEGDSTFVLFIKQISWRS